MRRAVELRRVGYAALALALSIAAALLVAETAGAQKPVITDTKPIEVVARPIHGFDRQEIDRQQFGRLKWRGGLVLSSLAEEFGGFSGVVLDDQGRRLFAVADTGAWLSAEVSYDGTRPARLQRAWMGPLRARDGTPLIRNRDRDAEAVALAEGSLTNGILLIAFEQFHRIGRFRITEAGPSAPLHYLELPPEVKLRSNRGFEAVSVLRGGPLKNSTIAFAERLKDDRGHHTGWIWLDGKPRKLFLTDIGGFDISDAAALDDGGLVVLERGFNWIEGFKMRLRLVRPDEISAGAVMQGDVLFEADMRYEIDNMEGVAVHRGPYGETVITVLSDDNFHPFQRTILLQFTLEKELSTERGEASD